MIDTQSIIEKECLQTIFPLSELGLAERPCGFQIVVKRSTINTMKKHGQTSMHAEVGGMLLGSLCWDCAPFLAIEASVTGEHTDGSAASVTFTAETWEHVWGVQERDFPDKTIVGWYHTHPGFGIFLSHMDMFICNHTFNAPHHVAYVYDPHSKDDGWFVWKNSVPTRHIPLIIEDEPMFSPIPTPTCSTSSPKITVLQAAAQTPIRMGYLLSLVIINLVLTIALCGGVGYLIYKQQ